jgi:acetyl-CoA carboxylase alpha subunit
MLRERTRLHACATISVWQSLKGYRKAIRLFDLVDRFGLPVITLVDTPRAFPGIEAEARGQAEAIARCTEKCLALGVPIIAVIVGEGGSVALSMAVRLRQPPEGCLFHSDRGRLAQ